MNIRDENLWCLHPQIISKTLSRRRLLAGVFPPHHPSDPWTAQNPRETRSNLSVPPGASEIDLAAGDVVFGPANWITSNTTINYLTVLFLYKISFLLFIYNTRRDDDSYLSIYI